MAGTRRRSHIRLWDVLSSGAWVFFLPFSKMVIVFSDVLFLRLSKDDILPFLSQSSSLIPPVATNHVIMADNVNFWASNVISCYAIVFFKLGSMKKIHCKYKKCEVVSLFIRKDYSLNSFCLVHALKKEVMISLSASYYVIGFIAFKISNMFVATPSVRRRRLHFADLQQRTDFIASNSILTMERVISNSHVVSVVFIILYKAQEKFVPSHVSCLVFRTLTVT